MSLCSSGEDPGKSSLIVGREFGRMGLVILNEVKNLVCTKYEILRLAFGGLRMTKGK
jgi:hypothetical protein